MPAVVQGMQVEFEVKAAPPVEYEPMGHRGSAPAFGADEPAIISDAEVIRVHAYANFGAIACREVITGIKV